MKIKRICEQCEKEFNFRGCPTDILTGRGKYCSNNCKIDSTRTLPKKFTCEFCGCKFPNRWGKIKRFCSHKCYAKYLIGSVPGNKGKKMPITSAKMMGNTNSLKGKFHHSWKGGISPINEKIRKSKIYARWRSHVYERDNYTCQKCGEKNGKLNADHELPFAYFLDLRLEILNGRTLCENCHKLTPTYGTKGKKLYETINI